MVRRKQGPDSPHAPHARPQRPTPIGTIAVEPSAGACPASPNPANPGQVPAVRPDAHGTLAQLLVSLSHALDLTEGQPLGHTVRSAHIGLRLADELALGDDHRYALYYTLLLKDTGCSSNAARMAALFGGDDREVKPRMKLVDWHRRVHHGFATLRTVAPGGTIAEKLRHFAGIAREGEVTRELIRLRCDRGAEIVAGLGFPTLASDAVRSLDEHWNGLGYPDGLEGEEIPVLSRIASLAQTVETHHARSGIDAAMHVVRSRRGRWFDPQLADLVLGWRDDRDWWRSLASPDSMNRLVDARPVEPAGSGRSAASELDLVARSFAEIVDAKSPFTGRHSVLVAAYADVIADAYGLDGEERARLRRAGLLHDIGKLGVSNRILDKAGGLAPEERQEMERHPLYTWEILSQVDAYADLARTAALHHEKLDGSGYPWRVPGDRLPAPARVLVVADTLEALTATRPYRGGLPLDEAIGILRRDRATRLCPRAVDTAESVLLSGDLELGSDEPLTRAGIANPSGSSTGSSAAA